jgi:hypothetical protein
MNQKYLNDMRYSWENDPRKIKVNDSIPNGRCFHCGRIMLNASRIDAFCRDCHKAMSVARDGPEHDYDNLMNGKEAYAHRETLEPVDFDMEEGFRRAQKSNFRTGTGKPVTAEDTIDHYDGLYDLR